MKINFNVKYTHMHESRSGCEQEPGTALLAGWISKRIWQDDGVLHMEGHLHAKGPPKLDDPFACAACALERPQHDLFFYPAFG